MFTKDLSFCMSLGREPTYSQAVILQVTEQYDQ